MGGDLGSSRNNLSTVRVSIPEMAFGDLVFVDTPGFDDSRDTQDSEVDVLTMVSKWLKLTYESISG